MTAYPYISISQVMLIEARRLEPETRVRRTRASDIDTITGHLGEFAFAQYVLGDWRLHRVGRNKGEADFESVEIKTSAFPLSDKLHLLVREDYAAKRKPEYYVQVIIDVQSKSADRIPVGTRAYLCGYARAEAVDAAPLKDFGSKLAGQGGYQCHYINITELISIRDLLIRE